MRATYFSRVGLPLKNNLKCYVSCFHKLVSFFPFSKKENPQYVGNLRYVRQSF